MAGALRTGMTGAAGRDRVAGAALPAWRADTPCGLVGDDGAPMPVSTMVRLVGDEVFGPGAARCVAATPCQGAAGTTYRLDFDRQGQRSALFVKLPTRSVERRPEFARRLREEFRVTQEVRQGFPETVALRTVAPAVFVEAVDGYASWAAPGVVLEGLLRQRCRRLGGPMHDALARCAQAAAWLDAFHRVPHPYGAVQARDALATYYEERLTTLAGIAGSGITTASSARVLDAFQRLLDSALAGTAIVRCHNDYSPHNMLVDGPTLTVLDYSFTGPGLPAFDVACFWHKLDDLRESPLVAPARVTRLQRAFVQAGATPFELDAPPVILGLGRLILSRMITRLRVPARRPDLRLLQGRRYRRWLRWLEGGFDPRQLTG